MKIIVLMKQVANKDAILRINKEATWIEEGDLSWEVNESDGYALEESLRLKEKHGGEVIVCTLGPQRAKAVIKDALARGADRAIHVVADDTVGMGPFRAAQILAEAVRGESPDLVMTGLQSTASDSTGAFWPPRSACSARYAPDWNVAKTGGSPDATTSASILP